MIKEPIVTPIFPTTLYIAEMERDFSKKEKEYIYEKDKELLINTGNKNSKERNVLDIENLIDLKLLLEDHIKNYIFEVLKAKKTFEPFITQSWINYTDPGSYHHEHDHPNSFLSGVVYIQTNNNDCINLYKPNYHQINIPIEEYNIFNSSTWNIPVKNGTIFLFPSSLRHSVSVVTGDKTRVSLSFNTFVKGSIGDKEGLTELNI